MLWKRSLDPKLKLKVRKFFTAYGAKNATELENLKRLNGLKRFRESSNRQLITIADIEMFNARTQIDRDKTLTIDQRAAKHRQVVERAVRLETALRAVN